MQHHEPNDDLRFLAEHRRALRILEDAGMRGTEMYDGIWLAYWQALATLIRRGRRARLARRMARRR